MMDDAARQQQELDDELVQSAALVHRRVNPVSTSTPTAALTALLNLLDTPDGRIRPEDQPAPLQR
ncbi:signal transduction histidine kinase [Deinococcus oregonensis]|uniref:Signal transduction histidine kinase n=1 Tax=Deinococcus oregonensis TaxID=1805970 RepID=A0ABV6B2G6_9DEIO